MTTQDKKITTFSIIPTAFTISRIFLGILFIVLFTIENQSIRPILFLLAITIELTDYFDGLLARRLKSSSQFGAILDHSTDSYVHISQFVCLLKGGIIPLWLVILFISREAIIGYFRLLSALYFGKHISSRLSGKMKTIGIGFSLILLVGLYSFSSKGENMIYFITYITAIGISTLVIIYSGVDYILSNWNILRLICKHSRRA